MIKVSRKCQENARKLLLGSWNILREQTLTMSALRHVFWLIESDFIGEKKETFIPFHTSRSSINASSKLHSSTLRTWMSIIIHNGHGCTVTSKVAIWFFPWSFIRRNTYHPEFSRVLFFMSCYFHIKKRRQEPA